MTLNVICLRYAGARRPHDLPVAEPRGGLEVVAVHQRLHLGAVDAHLRELVEPAGVVEVGVRGDGEQRVLPASTTSTSSSVLAVAQEPRGGDVVREAPEAQARVDHHVLVRAAQQPDVGAVLGLVEALLDPVEAVPQRL
ncbi:hypothetical protein CRUP_038324, partial [Coryphaenoides rupestris]